MVLEGIRRMELKVFTLPTCSGCSVAKEIALAVAQKYGVTYRVVDLATKEGSDEGLTYQVMSAPSIAIDKEVIARGRLMRKEKLEEEVKKRLCDHEPLPSS